MRIRKCPACKTKIKGIVSKCPGCGKRFKCKCGKELVDNKYKKCPLCRKKSEERAKNAGKGAAGAGVLVVGAAAVIKHILNKD